MTSPEIRLLKSIDEYRACERIQKAVWGNIGVGSEVMNVTQKYGGAVLGAVVRGKVVGFIYALLARRHNRLIHWSHMMAVLPGFRDLGLGFRMKLAHRKFALRQGIRWISWTYDPLQSRNAALNIARLGGIVEEYVPDCYGRFPSAIEKGLASDRFVVNWRIASPEVEKRLRTGPPRVSFIGMRRVNEAQPNAQGLLENRKIFLRRREPELLVEVPSHTDRMRARNIALARRWRNETRKIFLGYFAAGYRVDHFIPPGQASLGRCYYVLRRGRGSPA